MERIQSTTSSLQYFQIHILPVLSLGMAVSTTRRWWIASKALNFPLRNARRDRICGRRLFAREIYGFREKASNHRVLARTSIIKFSGFEDKSSAMKEVLKHNIPTLMDNFHKCLKLLRYFWGKRSQGQFILEPHWQSIDFHAYASQCKTKKWYFPTKRDVFDDHIILIEIRTIWILKYLYLDEAQISTSLTKLV